MKLTRTNWNSLSCFQVQFYTQGRTCPTVSSALSVVVFWIYASSIASPPSSSKVFSVSGISWDSMNRRWWQFRYVQDKKGLRQCLSMYFFRWFQANDKESCISFTLEYMYNVWTAWQVAKVRKITRCWFIHWRLPFLIL